MCVIPNANLYKEGGGGRIVQMWKRSSQGETDNSKSPIGCNCGCIHTVYISISFLSQVLIDQLFKVNFITKLTYIMDD